MILLAGLLIREAFSFWTGHPFDFEVWVRTGYEAAHGTDPYASFWPAVPGASFAYLGVQLTPAAYLPFWSGLLGELYRSVAGGGRREPVRPLLPPEAAGDPRRRRERLPPLSPRGAMDRPGRGGPCGALVLVVLPLRDHDHGHLGPVRLHCRACPARPAVRAERPRTQPPLRGGDLREVADRDLSAARGVPGARLEASRLRGGARASRRANAGGVRRRGLVVRGSHRKRCIPDPRRGHRDELCLPARSPRGLAAPRGGPGLLRVGGLRLGPWGGRRRMGGG